MQTKNSGEISVIWGCSEFMCATIMCVAYKSKHAFFRKTQNEMKINVRGKKIKQMKLEKENGQLR